MGTEQAVGIWSGEYRGVTYPHPRFMWCNFTLTDSAFQNSLVLTLVFTFVSAIIGHHPHLVQPSEARPGRWVSYSLGDFVGGDKTVSYLGITAEPNPFLGWRAIRMIRERPDVLQLQFRALLVAAGETGADLRVMLPMVSSLGEVERARELFDEASAALRAEGRALPERVQFGIMVEVPSAAVLAEHFARKVDFFSIGTNDLTQYTLAVDRTNERVAAMASPYHPAVLRLIAMTIQAAHAHGKWVGLCGELGGDVPAVPVLLGLGLDEFSMAPASIPAVKDAIRQWTLPESRRIAEHVLNLPTAIEVIEYLRSQQPPAG